MEANIVIIGASITGVYTMSELIRNGYEGKITLIDQEATLPYNPYPLTKEWMQDMDLDNPPLLKKPEYYEKHNVDLRLNRKVTRVDSKNKQVILDNDESIAYSDLVIATGSKLRKMSLPNDDAQGVFYLRSFKEAQAIKAWVHKAEKVVIIGSGFIGLELAATFRQLDKSVTILSKSKNPLANVFGMEVSDYFVKMHQDHGVKFIFEAQAQSFEKDEAGQLKAVITQDNERIEADMVIIAIGVLPNLSFEIEDLETNRDTIVVNEYHETSLEHVYAGGDIVSFPYHNHLIHIEHWENAWNQGRSLAKNLINKRSNKFAVTPYFWTDQYDHNFEYLGNTRSWDKLLLRGSLSDGRFAVAYVDENQKPLAILFVNQIEERKTIQAILDKDEPLDTELFVDINQPLITTQKE